MAVIWWYVWYINKLWVTVNHVMILLVRFAVHIACGVWRESHCEIERRRRTKMATYVNELCDMVPSCSTLARKPDKLTILRLAVAHMKTLQGGSESFLLYVVMSTSKIIPVCVWNVESHDLKCKLMTLFTVIVIYGWCCDLCLQLFFSLLTQDVWHVAYT